MSSRTRASTRASSVASENSAKIEKQAKMEMAAAAAAPSTKRSVSTRAAAKSAINDFEKIKHIAFLAFAAALVTVALVTYYVNNGSLILYPKTVSAEKLNGFAARAEYTLRYQCLLVFWLSINIHLVMFKRLYTLAINPLIESTEKQVQPIKNILSNSFEQILLSFFAQLTFASLAEPILILKFIPAINIVQFIGRILFYFGYPYYRTAGFALTSMPNSILIVYNLYKFGSWVNFY